LNDEFSIQFQNKTIIISKQSQELCTLPEDLFSKFDFKDECFKDAEKISAQEITKYGLAEAQIFKTQNILKEQQDIYYFVPPMFGLMFIGENGQCSTPFPFQTVIL